MSTHATVRLAEISDLGQLAGLFDQYRQFYRRGSDIASAERFLAERLELDESKIFVAESPQGNLLGFVQLYPGFTSLGMARTWTLNDLYVVESARGTGVGRQLMNAAHELALTTGARAINLETQIENTRAQSLYESMGYQAETGFRFYSKVVNPQPLPR